MKEEIVQLTRELVNIYSPYFKEAQVMEYAYEWLNSRNIPAEFHKYHESKVTNFEGINLVGKITGKGNGPKILLNGHLDTVYLTDGWTKDPFEGIIEEDRLYGLGALDMKGGSAAIMLALDMFLKNHEDFNGEIVYSFVSDEEGPYGLGTDSLIRDGYADGINFSIVTEPSAGFCNIEYPCLCLGARGGYNYTVTLTGKASHAANPELGVNAIVDMSKVICQLENIEFVNDPLLGMGDLAVIDVKGGGAAASVAESENFTVFRHVVRGEDKVTLRNEIIEAVKRADIKSSWKMNFRPAPYEEVDGFIPYAVDEENKYTKLIQRSIMDISGKNGEIAYFSSIGDFNYLGTRLNAPTYIFGPYGENYHTGDEWVSIESLVDTCRTIYRILEIALDAK
ncbi:MAG: M20/M25/M40 family metallo-hydrolase [Gudongella sp.]|jgi:succinyl-diaminopimelate desuccinylase|nr:M20/M25/M40 family metallo-hydrolase [Gudongella sp.]